MLISLQDVFKFNPNYLENKEKYKAIKAEILDEDSDETESWSEESSDDDEEEGGSCMQYSEYFDSYPFCSRQVQGRNWEPYGDEPCEFASHNVFPLNWVIALSCALSKIRLSLIS